MAARTKLLGKAPRLEPCMRVVSEQREWLVSCGKGCELGIRLGVPIAGLVPACAPGGPHSELHHLCRHAAAFRISPQGIKKRGACDGGW